MLDKTEVKLKVVYTCYGKNKIFNRSLRTNHNNSQKAIK